MSNFADELAVSDYFASRPQGFSEYDGDAPVSGDESWEAHLARVERNGSTPFPPF